MDTIPYRGPVVQVNGETGALRYRWHCNVCKRVSGWKATAGEARARMREHEAGTPHRVSRRLEATG